MKLPPYFLTSLGLISAKEKEPKRKGTEKQMSLKEQYPDIGEGWSSILETLDSIHTALSELNSYHGIKSIERSNGMLKVQFEIEVAETHPIYFILDSIAYRIERMTAKICEDCGRYGLRRIDLPTIQTLCTSCYALKYSEMVEKTS